MSDQRERIEYLRAQFHVFQDKGRDGRAIHALSACLLRQKEIVRELRSLGVDDPTARADDAGRVDRRGSAPE